MKPSKPSGRVRTVVESVVAALATVLALVLANAVACRSHAKVDLTENGVYSLLDASRNLVRTLPELVTVRSYFDNVPPEQATQQAFVESLLAEYADASGGKLVYTKADVDAADNPAAAAQQKTLAAEGVKRVMLLSIKDDRRQQIPAYFAVKFSHLDKEEVWQLPNNFVAEGLEYEFSTILRRLVSGKKRLGVTQGFGEPAQHRAFEAQKGGLADLYEIVPIAWNSEPHTIAGIDLLLVNGPTTKVSDAALYQLDQHLLRGKGALLLVRGMSWGPGGGPGGGEQQMPGAEAPFVGLTAEHGLGDFLAHLGVKVRDDIVVDQRSPVDGLVPVSGQLVKTNIFFPLVNVLDRGKHAPLAGLDGLVLPYASSLELVGALATGTGFTVQRLLESGPTAVARDDLRAVTLSTRLTASATARRGPHLLGITATGTWPSYFAGKPVPEGAVAAATAADAIVDSAEPATPEAAPRLDAALAPARLVVIPSAAFVEDQIAVMMQQLRDPRFLNGFVALHGLVDWAAAETDLLAVRTKQVMRPIGGLESSDRLLLKYGNVFGVPLALVLFGLISWRLRERRRRRIAL